MSRRAIGAVVFATAYFGSAGIFILVVRSTKAEANERLDGVESQLAAASAALGDGSIAQAEPACARARSAADLALAVANGSPIAKAFGYPARAIEARARADALGVEIATRKAAAYDALRAFSDRVDALGPVREAIARAPKRDRAIVAIEDAADRLERKQWAQAIAAVRGVRVFLPADAPQPRFVPAARAELLRPAIAEAARLLAGHDPYKAAGVVEGVTIEDEETRALVGRLSSFTVVVDRDPRAARAELDAVGDLSDALVPLRAYLERRERRAADHEGWKTAAPTFFASLATLARTGKAVKGFAPPLRGRAVVIGLDGKLHEAHERLPDELRAGPSDEKMTVFLIRSSRDEVCGVYADSPAELELERAMGTKPKARAAAILVRLEVAVILWPEKKLVGVAEVECPPPKFVPTSGDLKAVRGFEDIELQCWINDLAKKPR